MKRTFVLLAACSLMYGCGTGTFTYTADTKPVPYSKDCSFKVLSTLPKGNFNEIGVVNVQMGGYGGNPRTPVEFKEMIQKDVCDAGGDLVIGEVNGYGIYIRGTVFKKNK